MLSKNVDERPQSMAEVVKRIEDLLKVTSAQFAAMVAVPPGFPVRGPVDESFDDRAAEGSAEGVPRSMGASNPSGRGDRAIQSTPPSAGGTKLLPQPQTTFSQTASELATPRNSSQSTGKTLLKVAIAMATLAGGAAVLFAFWPTPSRGSRIKPAAELAVPETPASAVQAQPAEPARPRSVTIELENGPVGLSVEIDGRLTSVPVTVPHGSETHLLTFRAPGFKPEVARVDGSRDKTIVLNMQQEPARLPKAKPRLQRGSPEPPNPKAEEPTPGHTVRKKHDGFTDL
jgi:hypothetical protein